MLNLILHLKNHQKVETSLTFSIFFEGLEKFAIKQPGIKDKYTSEKAKEKFSTDDNFCSAKNTWKTF